MRLRWGALLLLLSGFSGWAQNDKEAVDTVGIDLGWVAVVQQSRGWLITSAPPAPPISATKRNLKTGDVLLRIDGHDLAELGPLAVARMLDDVPSRTVPIELVRHGKTYDVQAFGEGVLTDGKNKSAPTYSLNELQKRGEPAPQFSLTDLQGQDHTLDSYRGTWVLLNFWGTWCSGCMQEIPALNDLNTNYKATVTVVSISINDSPETLKRFLTQHAISYPVLVGGTFDDPFARRYNVHGAPTNVAISPNGDVRFVGVGPMALKGAVETVARGQRSAPTR